MAYLVICIRLKDVFDLHSHYQGDGVKTRYE
jgi:hypothetical protein